MRKKNFHIKMLNIFKVKSCNPLLAKTTHKAMNRLQCIIVFVPIFVHNVTVAIRNENVPKY